MVELNIGDGALALAFRTKKLIFVHRVHPRSEICTSARFGYWKIHSVVQS